MGKKKSNKKVKVNSISPLIPILFLILIIYFGFKFLSTQSNINISRKNDSLYEQKLSSNNYAYIEDIKYKKDIIKSAKNYSLTDLNFVMGPDELKSFINNSDNNPYIYAYGVYNPVSGSYLRERKMRANLNIHSMITDGHIELQSILNQAAEYGDIIAKAYPGQKYIISISDLNSLDNAKQIIDIVRKNPNKYSNIRVVFGIEISTTLEPNDIVEESSKVNLLALCINPFDKALQQEFPKQSMFSSYESINHDFDDMIEILNSQPYLIYGIAKPLHDYVYADNKYTYLPNIFKYYDMKNAGYKFVEAYYNPYTYSKSAEVNQMNMLLNTYNFHRVGSLGDYGDNLFEY